MAITGYLMANRFRRHSLVAESDLRLDPQKQEEFLAGINDSTRTFAEYPEDRGLSDNA